MGRFPTDSFSYFSAHIFKFMNECGLLHALTVSTFDLIQHTMSG
jgi:hypothetical protein